MNKFCLLNNYLSNLNKMFLNNHNSPPPNYLSSKRATNTFSQYPSIQQLFSYLIIIFDIITFYVCVH